MPARGVGDRAIADGGTGLHHLETVSVDRTRFPLLGERLPRRARRGRPPLGAAPTLVGTALTTRKAAASPGSGTSGCTIAPDGARRR